MLMEKGMHGGIPKLRRLSLLEYFLGVHGGIPKLERLTLLNLFIIFPRTLENSLHT